MAEVPPRITTPFAALSAPRVDHTKQHCLLNNLTISLCALLCGADDFVKTVTFAEAE